MNRRAGSAPLLHRPSWLLQHAVGFKLWAVLGSLGLSLGLALWAQERQLDAAEAAVSADAARLERQLQRLVEQGMVSGGLRLMGTVDEALKERLQNRRWAEGGRSQMLASRALAIGADGLMLVDQHGRVVERWDPDAERSVAPQWRAAANRPGADVAILALADTGSLDHSLLLVAPVWKRQIPQPDDSEAVLGSLVVRLDPGTMRSYLSTARAHTALVAPLGRTVAATTHPGALLHPLPKAAAALVSGRYDLDHRLLLPVPQRLVVRRDLSWPLPPQADGSAASGRWSLLVVRDVPGMGVRDFPVVAWVAGLLAFTAAMGLLRLLRERDAQLRERTANEALAEDNREQAAWRARLGEAVLGLQETNDVQELGAQFFRFLHDHLGSVQGVLYERVADRLTLAAHWGCAGEPAPGFPLGQGLLGQAAQAMETVHVQGDAAGPAGAVHTPPLPMVQSALGEAPLASRLILPIVYHGHCLAVVELGWLQPIDARVRDRAQSLADLLGVNLQLLQARR